MQVLPGVYQVNGSPYGRHQNGYRIHRDGATLLIDSGDLAEDTFEEAQRNVARWGLHPKQVTHLLLTHAHFDHASHAARWQRGGVRIVASPETAEAIAVGDECCIGYEVQRTFEPCEADEVIRNGETLRVDDLSVRAIAAPGHAAGLLIYEIVLDGERF